MGKKVRKREQGKESKTVKGKEGFGRGKDNIEKGEFLKGRRVWEREGREARALEKKEGWGKDGLEEKGLKKEKKFRKRKLSNGKGKALSERGKEGLGKAC